MYVSRLQQTKVVAKANDFVSNFQTTVNATRVMNNLL